MLHCQWCPVAQEIKSFAIGKLTLEGSSEGYEGPNGGEILSCPDIQCQYQVSL